MCVFSYSCISHTVCLEDTTVNFEIWDAAGQEWYHSLAPIYYRGARAAIVVYDITNQVISVIDYNTVPVMYPLTQIEK